MSLNKSLQINIPGRPAKVTSIRGKHMRERARGGRTAPDTEI